MYGYIITDVSILMLINFQVVSSLEPITNGDTLYIPFGTLVKIFLLGIYLEMKVPLLKNVPFISPTSVFESS